MRNNKSEVYCTFNDAPEHRFRGHPESPRRLELLKKWLDHPPYPEMQWLDFEPATEGEISLVHHRTLLDDLAEEVQQGPHEIDFSPTYVTAQSYQVARSAVGATLSVSRKILEEGTGRGFAVVRPPGHHAEPSDPFGFCLLNNIAIAG